MKRMNQIKRIILITILTGVCLFLVACSQSLFDNTKNSDSSQTATLHLSSSVVSLSRGWKTAARTVRPADTVLAIDHYHVAGTGPDDATYSDDFTDSDITTDSLAVGTWDFTVTALNADDITLLTGSTELMTNPVETVSATVELTRPSGTGSVLLSIAFDSAVTLSSDDSNTSLTIETLDTDGDVTATDDTASFTEGTDGSLSYTSDSLEAGDYNFTAVFTDSGDNELYFFETVQVFAGITSSAEFTYTADDFTGDLTSVTGVYLDWNSMYLTVDESSTITYVINPTNAVDQTVTWASSDSSVATVDSTGSVSAIGKGNAVITITTEEGDFSDTCTIDVGTATCEIGDTGPAGGIVFYDAGDYTTYGWRYLECAPEDFEQGIPWNNGSYVYVDTDTAIGTGAANTTAIITAQGAGTYAAEVCADYSLNGYCDWFLPSKDELELVYENLKANDLGSFEDEDYWSSSQYETNYAWHLYFTEGGLFTDTDTFGDGGEYVRAIREF